MKRDELIKLRGLVNAEVEKIKELLKSDLVKEYLEITKMNSKELDMDNLLEIINQILNPHNSNVFSNCSSEVKNDFFVKFIKFGQAKSKRLILSKYPRL